MKLSRFYYGIIAGFFLVTIFNFSLITNITKPVGLAYADDTYHVYFIIKHYIDVFNSGNWSNLPTLPMFYGTKNSLFFLDHHILHGLIAIPIYLLTKDVITTSNILMIATLYASFISMYILAWYFTKNIFPSLIAAIIYVFNPFISDWVPGYMLLFSFQWTPLIILFFEKLLVKSNNKNGFFFFFFLIIKLLGASLYYSVFLMVLLPIYIFIRIWQQKIQPLSLINKGTIFGFTLFMAIAAINGYLYLRVFTTNPPNRDIKSSEYFYSAWASSWFFTSKTNILYGSLLSKAINTYPDLFPLRNNEQNLFWGIVPIILFIVSFKVLPKSPLKKYWIAFLILLVISILMAFGPVMHLTDTISFPGLYSLVYKLNPLFHFTRVPARFGAFVFLFLGLIISLTIVEIMKKMALNKSTILSSIIILLIVFEYRNYPIEFTTIPPETKSFYDLLNKQTQIKEIIDLPIANRLPSSDPNARAEYADADYFLPATILHNKIMFNGYSSFMPEEFNRRAILISVDFPTKAKLELLKKWHVDAIILHKDEYKSPLDYETVKQKLILQGIPLKEESPTSGLALFDLTD